MRVLSYNIHKGIGGRDRRYRLERILDVIAAERPDLACLQEVTRDSRRSGDDDQPHRLAEAMGAVAHLYQMNVRWKVGGYGNLVLSRWPFVRMHQISLRMGDRKPRGAQLVVVDTPEGHLHLVNWHLGLAESTRQWQADHLLGHRLFRESAHLPTLIVGDSNDWRNTLARGPFARHGFRQVTDPPSRFRSFPAYLALGSLDKAFSCGEVHIGQARMVRTALSRVASDHLPLVIDLHMRAADLPEPGLAIDTIQTM